MGLKSFFERPSLQRRIILLTAFGMFTMLLILGISDFLSIRDSVNQTLRERLVLAQTVANNLEHLIRQNLMYLQDVAFSKGVNLGDEDLGPEKSALHNAFLRSIFANVFLLDSEVHLLWIEPPRRALAEANFGDFPPVRESILTGKPIVSNLFEIRPQAKKAVFALIPIVKNGRTLGLVGGEIDPTGAALANVIQPVKIGETGYIEIIDGNGFVLASTNSENILTESDHGGILSALIKTGRSSVGTCHSCHEEALTKQPKKEIMAFTPLSEIPWGVNIRQSEKEALAPVESMKRRFFTFGFFLFIVALILTWGVAQSVIAPVKSLTSSARRIASGNLVDPISISGDDEIGQLGKALDEMRIKLKGSLDEIGGWTRELERRVDERTKEASSLYEELKRKEEKRGELLRKIISAQEEERKRIARELHDELSQTVTALLIALESVREVDSTKSVEGKIASIRDLAVRAVDSVHRMIFDLRPAVLDDLGLSAAVKWYTEERLKPLGINVHFEGDMFEVRLPSGIETALFRVAQEAITNVAKHSEAENVIINLELGNSNVNLEIEDDGKGFDPGSVSDTREGSKGLGLLGMKERVLLLEGTLEIQSRPGYGTMIAITVPLREVVK
jgi:signal transduction histidine kinase